MEAAVKKQTIFFLICLFAIINFDLLADDKAKDNIKIDTTASRMIVHAPVANVRLCPKKVNICKLGKKTDKRPRCSQILFGEKVWGKDQKNSDEVHVRLVIQKRFDGKKWVGIPGFVNKDKLSKVLAFPQYTAILQDHLTPLYVSMNSNKKPLMYLSMGTLLETKEVNNHWQKITLNGKKYYIPNKTNILKLSCKVETNTDTIRKNIVNTALQFLNTPYVYGGRSFFNKNTKKPKTGVDCSGLINLAYLAGAGLVIPRTSRNQKRNCTILKKASELKAGDLIFFAKNDLTQRVVHVAMYIGNGKMIESSGSKDANKKKIGVRIITVEEKIGVPFDSIESEKTVTKTGKLIFLGTCLQSHKKIKKMRSLLFQEPSNPFIC